MHEKFSPKSSLIKGFADIGRAFMSLTDPTKHRSWARDEYSNPGVADSEAIKGDFERISQDMHQAINDVKLRTHKEDI